MKYVVGEQVFVKAKQCSGVIKYQGSLPGQEGIFYGIALSKPLGKNFGNYKSKQYFSCHRNEGIFVRSQNLEKQNIKINNENSRNLVANEQNKTDAVKPFQKLKEFDVTHLPILSSEKNQHGIIAYGATDHYPYLFDTLSLTLTKPNFKSKLGHREWVTSVTWSKNGRKLYTAGMKGVVCCWSQNLVCRSETQIHNGSISKLERIDDTTLASSSYDKTLKLIDISQGDKIAVTATLAGHSDCVTDFQVLNEFSLVSVSRGAEYKAWDRTKAQNIYSYDRFKGQISALEVNRFLGFTGDQGGWLKIFDHRQKTPIFQIKKHDQAITGIAIYGSISNLSVITVASDLKLKLSNVKDGFTSTSHCNTVKDFPYIVKQIEEKLYISDGQGQFYAFNKRDLSLLSTSKVSTSASRCIDFAENEIVLAGDEGNVSILAS